MKPHYENLSLFRFTHIHYICRAANFFLSFQQSSLGFAAVVVPRAKALHQSAFLRRFSQRLNWKYEGDQISAGGIGVGV